MSLQSTAQELLVIDPSMVQHMNKDEMPSFTSELPLEVMDDKPESPESEGMKTMEVSEPHDIEIVIEDLPGAPPGTHDPEPMLEVSEPEEDKSKIDDNEAKSKKPEKWDWASKGAEGFVSWIKERIDDIPKHSGYDSAGLERAVSYLEKLDNEISKAMRLDLDGELDANKIEAVRATIDDGISKLHDRLDKVKSSKKSKRKKKSEIELDGLVKEAQKITGVQGVYVTVPLLISSIARVCVNGMVSGGHDIEDMFEKLSKKYKLNDRERMETIQLLDDMGYYMRRDRGYFPEEDIDVASSDNFDWGANYKG